MFSWCSCWFDFFLRATFNAIPKKKKSRMFQPHANGLIGKNIKTCLKMNSWFVNTHHMTNSTRGCIQCWHLNGVVVSLLRMCCAKKKKKKNRKLQIYFKWFLSLLGIFGLGSPMIFNAGMCVVVVILFQNEFIIKNLQFMQMKDTVFNLHKT